MLASFLFSYKIILLTLKTSCLPQEWAKVEAGLAATPTAAEGSGKGRKARGAFPRMGCLVGCRGLHPYACIPHVHDLLVNLEPQESQCFQSPPRFPQSGLSCPGRVRWSKAGTLLKAPTCPLPFFIVLISIYTDTC